VCDLETSRMGAPYIYIYIYIYDISTLRVKLMYSHIKHNKVFKIVRAIHFDFTDCQYERC